MKFSERLKQLNLDKTEQFLIYLFLSTLLIALILITTKMGIWAVQLEQILFYYFVAWVFLGFVTFAMITKDISKRYDTKKPGKALLYYGFLATLWAVMGSQFLNLSYWGSVSDWVSAVGLIVLTMYLVQETINQRKLQYKPELFVKNNNFELYFHNINTFIKNHDLDNSELKYHLGIWNISYERPEYYEKMVFDTLSNFKKEDLKSHLMVDKLETFIDSQVSLEIYNIGKGFAKNIWYTWEINHSKLFEGVYKKYKNDPIIYNEKNEFVTSYFFGLTPHISLKNDNIISRNKFNLLAPYKFEKDILKIPMPPKLLKLIGLASKRGIHSDLTRYPLKLNLNYEDIYGEQHTKIFIFRSIESFMGKYDCYPDYLVGDTEQDFVYYNFTIYEQNSK